MTELLEIFDGRTVAIVGNGEEQEDHSAEIDACDVVVRFNHFYNYDSGHVGKKVDVIIQTFTTAWVKAEQKHADVIKAQKPKIFCGKKAQQYNPPQVAGFLGDDICVSNWTSELAPWAKYTTGGAFLCWLASKPRNAKFKVFGFPRGAAADKYWSGDAKHYAPLKDEELAAQARAISIIEMQRVTSPRVERKPVVLIPVKASSEGCPGKNERLLPICIAKLAPLGYDIHLVGDGADRLREIALSVPGVDAEKIHAFLTPPPTGEVTDDMRMWRDHTGYHGEIIHVQCTSPSMKPEWVAACIAARRHAPVAATCCRINFKVNCMYAQNNGVWLQLVEGFGPPSAPRQSLPPVVRLTGAVFAFHSDALDCRSFYDAGVLRPVIVEERDALDVDTPEDLAKAFTKTNQKEVQL